MEQFIISYKNELYNVEFGMYHKSKITKILDENIEESINLSYTKISQETKGMNDKKLLKLDLVKTLSPFRGHR